MIAKFLLRLFSLPKDIFEFWVVYQPGVLGQKLRYRYYKKKLKYLGKNVAFGEGSKITNPQFVSIDDNSWIDQYVLVLAGKSSRKRETRFIKNRNFKYEEGEVWIGKNVHVAPFSVLNGHGGIQVGDNCGFASGSKIISFSNHYRSFDNPDKETIFFTTQAEDSQQSIIAGPVVIQDGCGVATNTIVMPGVTLKKNSIVLANSVVVTDCKENFVYSGNPARRIEERF